MFLVFILVPYTSWIALKNNAITFIYCICMPTHAHHSTHVESRVKFAGLSSLLPRGCWGPTQAWQPVPRLAEPSRQPWVEFLIGLRALGRLWLFVCFFLTNV